MTKEKGILDWNEDTDISIDNLNLYCKSRKENKPKKSIIEKIEGKTTKFYEREITDITFEDCKPMTKRNPLTNQEESIDKNQRLFSQNITIQQYKLGRELSFDDQTLDIETRKFLLNTRLQTLDNRIKDPEFASDKDQILKDRAKIDEKIKKLEQQKESVQTQKLFEE